MDALEEERKAPFLKEKRSLKLADLLTKA